MTVAAGTGLAATLSSAVDEAAGWRAEGWATDFSRHSVDLAEIISGGPPRDGIPSIDEPRFKPVSEIDDLAETEPVIGLAIGEDARAYPLRVLTWHEIVNDQVGGLPLIVTYCPLCNAALVFERSVDGRLLDFGTTGKLRHSDLVMYDRQTESWWQQFTGEAIVGGFTGTRLPLVPSRLESFALFKERHPEGRVLVPNDPNFRRYGHNPYVGYDTAPRPFLFRGELPDGIDPMARVVVVRAEGEGAPRGAVALHLLRERGTMRLGDVVLSWREGQASALDTAVIARGRDVGNVVAQRADADGSLHDVPYDVTFAFVFHAFHPDAPLIKQ